jgi:GrpB-like predicted nucleotidyltransferase (UPF0157 family)
MSLGVKRNTVVLLPYDENWAAQFIIEQNVLAELFEIPFEKIEHIGSTAVPGLPAKPLLDIAVLIDDLDELDCELKLKAIGYIEKVGRLTGRQRVFVKEKEEIVTHHLHLIEKGTEHWAEKIDFRDYLCQNETARLEYQRLKESLSTKYKDERRKYTEAKAEFIQKCIKAINEQPC